MLMQYICIVLLLITLAQQTNEADVCESTDEVMEDITKKYLLFTVNYGEGFNLRRDVFIRMANFLHMLNQKNNETWFLVLPPWYGLYHWINMITTTPLPWSEFFDLTSMNKYVPVMELEQYIIEADRAVDRVYILQRFAEGWSGSWEEKYEERPCIEPHEFRQTEQGWEGTVSGRLLWTEQLSCVSVQGNLPTLAPLLQAAPSSITLGRAETLLHSEFPTSPHFWRCRRSMRFAPRLAALAKRFREEVLGANDDRDGVTLPRDWRDERPRRDRAVGGPYLAVHWRRRDFLRARGDQLPDVPHTATQLRQVMDQMTSLKHVFLATDAPQEEVSELVELLQPYSVVRYSAAAAAILDGGGGSVSELNDGQLAIIDQIIAAHARHFIGSHESTFTYRIHEEREILGFAANSTFNRLCGTAGECEQPARWTIVY